MMLPSMSKVNDLFLNREKYTYYMSDGVAIDQELSAAAIEQFWKWTLEDEPAPKINCEDFSRQKLEKSLKKRAKELEPKEISHIKYVFNNFVVSTALWFGTSLRNIDVSAINNGDEEIPGGDLKMSGLSDIVMALRKELPEDKVVLNHEVKKIEMVGELVIVSSEKDQYQAKHVIVTTALGF